MKKRIIAVAFAFALFVMPVAASATTVQPHGIIWCRNCFTP